VVGSKLCCSSGGPPGGPLAGVLDVNATSLTQSTLD
jgi:hypothetical protein